MEYQHVTRPVPMHGFQFLGHITVHYARETVLPCNELAQWLVISWLRIVEW